MKISALAAVLSLTALPTLAMAAPPAPTIINFDGVQDGTVINTTYAAQGITFSVENASPFTQSIQATTDGGAFSSNALDATMGVVNVQLNQTSAFKGGLNAFQVKTLADPEGFGSSSVTFQFYGANDALLFTSAAYDQTQTQTFLFTGLTGVQRIALPADAYYDDFSIQAVPEASTSLSLGLLLAGGGLLFARRRQGANAA